MKYHKRRGIAMKKAILSIATGLVLSANVFAAETPLYIFTGAVACLGITDGSVQYSKVPVEPDTVFAQGEDVLVLAEFKNVVGKHRFRVKKFLDGISYGEATTGWKNEEEKWVWDYSYFVPSQLEARPGRWKFVIYFGKKDGTFVEVGEANFRVRREDSPYTFTGAVACLGIADGSVQYSKVPVGADSVFTAGDTVYVLAEMTNVYIDHQFAVAVFRNGQYWSGYTSDWKEVGFGWDYSYFTPRQENIRAGAWEFVIYLNKEGVNFQFLARVKFVVNEDEPTAVKEDALIPFSLNQNYPNPFDPATAISFNLGQGNNTRLEVFNSSGQGVATLIDGYLEAGHHSVSWNAAGLSAGIYFTRLRSGNFTATTKMTLLK
ncbi:MAG: T9SS type A sorting domain-containing protein [Patescibacteria group bacterium]|nr:T9SS type A sorting domain-containing protein [Patescibacteria group bacterium]